MHGMLALPSSQGRAGLLSGALVAVLLGSCGGDGDSTPATTRHALPVLEQRPGGRQAPVAFLRASIALPRGGRFKAEQDYSSWGRKLDPSKQRSCEIGGILGVLAERTGNVEVPRDARGEQRVSTSILLRLPNGSSRRLKARGFLASSQGATFAQATARLPRDVAPGYPKRTVGVAFSYFGAEEGRGCGRRGVRAARDAVQIGLRGVQLTVTGRYETPAPDRLARRMPVQSVAGLRVIGQPGDDGLLGDDVASAGDVNGDGRPDLLAVAANQSVRRRFSAGAAYVVFGSSQPGRIDLGEHSDRVLRIEGPSKDAQLQAAASAGDVTGDGLDDVAVGATDAERGGVVYLVAGRRAGGRVDLRRRGDAVARITGAGGCANLGEQVANVGDVNADGIGDLGLTAPENCSARDASGWIVFGRRRARDVDLRRLGKDGLRIAGIADAADVRIAGAGDVNGDGIRDVVLGAHFAGGDLDTEESPPGVAWVIFGRRDGGSVRVDRLGPNGVRFTGVGCDSAGESVAGLGDVNADGLADVAIGAPQSCTDAANPGGVVYVVHGDRKLRGGSLPTVVRRRGLRINGIESKSLGQTVARAGDLDGDGRDDLLVNDLDGVYLLAVPRAGRVLELRRAGARAIHLITPRGIDSVGDALATTGDLDGDGRREILIGYPTARRGGREAGAAQLVFSRHLRPR